MEHRLYRSVRHRVIGGVCGGIADHFGWDPFLVRVVLFFLLTPLVLFILFSYSFSLMILEVKMVVLL